MARTVQGRPVEWAPNPGPQTEFLQSSVYELLYGGAAGGGKSESLIFAPLRWAGNRFFHAVLFRRTYPELESSLIERTKLYYPQLGARYNETKHQWRFPSGALIDLRALQYDKDVSTHQSAEYQFIGFDELTHFTAAQYKYLLSRLRSSRGLPRRVRSGTNPDICWVKDRWAPWVNRSQEYLASGGPLAQSGEILYFKPNAEGGEEYVPKGTPGSKSRCFIRSSRHDTPQLDADYGIQLLQLDAVQRARLDEGDWEAVPAPGKYFKREWCDTCSRDEVPKDARMIRHWDRAGTTKGEKNSHDPDWTAGVLMARKGSHYWVVDVQRFRRSPGQVDEAMLSSAKLDGRSVAVGVNQDPGQAGKDQALRLVRMLSGWNVRSSIERGDKIRRFGPFSAQAEHHNVSIVRGAWNSAYYYELESLPTPNVHDDQVDGTSGGFNHLSTASDGGMSCEDFGLM